MNKYPYPVLTEEGSSYRENIVFEISYIRNSYIAEKLVFEFDIKMNSQHLKELITLGKANMYLKVQNNIYTFLKLVDVIDGRYNIEVETERLQANDNIKFTALIVAEEDIDLVYNEEMLDIYNGDTVMKIRKKNVLAISNEESLSYNTSNNDFIKFTVSNEMSGKGYSIKIKENFINVVVGPELNVAYGLVKNNKKDACVVYDSHLVFEVFIYLLIESVQDYEIRKGEEWYKLFEQIFLQSSGYKDMETFISNVMDDMRIDMAQIFEVAQKMINNQLENSLITIGRS